MYQVRAPSQDTQARPYKTLNRHIIRHVSAPLQVAQAPLYETLTLVMGSPLASARWMAQARQGLKEWIEVSLTKVSGVSGRGNHGPAAFKG